MEQEQLKLATIFTGRVDATFRRAVGQLKSIIQGLGAVQEKISRASKYTEQTRELTEYAKVAGNATNETNKYRQALARLAAQHGNTGTALKTVKAALDSAEKSIQKHAAAIRNNTALGDRAKIIADKYAASADRAALANIKLSKSEYQVAQTKKDVVTQTQRVANAAKQADTTYQGFTKQISRVHGGLERIKAAFKVTASYLIAARTVQGFTQALSAGVNEIIDFDQALINVQAITGATTAQLASMRNVLIDIATRTKFSTTELAEGLVLLGQSGFSAEESIKAIGAVADLAAGTLSDMRTITDLLTTSIRAFNLEPIDTTRVADVMANAINKSKLTVDKLNTAFNFVGASASQAGLSIEQTAAAMMVLANNGQRASTIGTGLRQVLARMMAPSSRIREEFEAYGISLTKINPLNAGFEKALRNLIPAIWNTEKGVVDMGKAYQLFGLRGAQAIAVLAKSFHGGKGSFQDMLAKTYDVGTASEMAAIQAQGLAFKIKNLADVAKRMSLAFGNGGVKGVLVALVDILRLTVIGISELLETTGGQAVLQFTLWTAAIWGTTKAIGLLMTTGLAEWVVFVSQSIRGQMLLGVTELGVRLTKVQVISNLIWTTWQKLKMHPFLLIAGGITALVLGMHRIATASLEAIKRFQQINVSARSNIDSLVAYRGALADLKKRMNSGEDVGREYSALLKRLKKDHSDLSDAVNITTVAINDMQKLIDKSIRKQSNISRGALLGIIINAGKELDKLKSKFNNEIIFDFDTKSFQKVGSIRKKYNKQMNEASQQLVADLAEDVNSGIMSMEHAELELSAIMESTNVRWQDRGRILRELSLAIKDLEKRDKDVIKGFDKEISTLPEEWQKVYNDLDIRGKVHLVAQKKLAEQRVAAFKKESSGMLKAGVASEEEAEKARVEIWNEALEEFLEKRKNKKLKSIADEHKQEYSLETQRLRILGRLRSDEQEEIEDNYKQRKTEIDEWYNKFKDAENKKISGILGANKTKDFVKRIIDPINSPSLKIGDTVASHLMAWGEVDGKAIAFPTIIRDKFGKLIKLGMDEAWEYALKSGEYIRFDTAEEADWFSKNYKIAWGEAGEAEKQYNELVLANIDNRKKALQKYFSDKKDKEIDLEVRSLEYQDKKIEAINKEIKYLRDKKAQLIENGESEKRSLDINELDVEILKKQKELAEELTRVEENKYKERLSKHRKFSEEYTSIMTTMYNAGMVTTEAFESYLDRKAKHRAELFKELYDQGRVSKDEYLDAIEELYERKGLSEGEYQEKKTMLKGTPFEQFLFGIQKAKKTWEELRIELGNKLPDKMATGLTDNLLDFIDKTKSAKDAVRDFARSTLRWLGEIILKQTILNSIMKIFGFHTGGVVGKDAAVPVYHSGGVPGLDNVPKRNIGNLFVPEFHNGFRSNEILSLIKNDEVVLTEGQQKLFAKMIKDAGGSGGPINYYDLSSSNYWNEKQAIELVESLSIKNINEHASNVILNDLDSDHPLRNRLRGKF